jgi:hypothetical protein
VSELTWDSDFERINRHRALAELVIHNRNWLPWWIITSVCNDFASQGERWLNGEGLPPLPVRLWWAYRHWKFRRAHRPEKIIRKPSLIDTMQQSKITGDRFTPMATIPLPEGQHVKFIPVAHRQGHEIEVTDMKSGKRRKVFIDDEMLKNIVDPRWHQLLPDVPPEMRAAVWFSDDGSDYKIETTQVRDLKRKWVESQREPIPTSLGSYPRPNCPKCHTPSPHLGTPLDPDSPSGWGDSFFTCSNYDCKHSWKWKKVYPLLEENSNKEGTKTGAKLKGTDIPFHLFKEAGCTVEQVNAAIRKFANVACLATMTPGQQKQIAETIQKSDEHENICTFNGLPLARVTPSRKPGDRPVTVV